MWIADDDLVRDMTKTQPPTLIAVHLFIFLSCVETNFVWNKLCQTTIC